MRINGSRSKNSVKHKNSLTSDWLVFYFYTNSWSSFICIHFICFKYSYLTWIIRLIFIIGLDIIKQLYVLQVKIRYYIHQVFLSNTNNCWKFQIIIIPSKWLVSSIWLRVGILTGTINFSSSGPCSNGNEWLFYVPQSSRTGASPSDTV